jgi:hypothetical protein
MTKSAGSNEPSTKTFFQFIKVVNLEPNADDVVRLQHGSAFTQTKPQAETN